MAAKKKTEEKRRDEPKEILLTNRFAVIELPEETISVTIDAQILQAGEVIHVTRTMSPRQVIEAFIKAEEGYIDEDDVFTLTEQGKRITELLAEHEAEVGL